MTCSKCGSKMERRVNFLTKVEFWGCLRFPKCKGTAPVEKEKPT